MNTTVYVETTIQSYFTAKPSRNIVRAGEQQLTRDWWGSVPDLSCAPRLWCYWSAGLAIRVRRLCG